MAHVLFALRAHSDVAKLELEDDVARKAAAVLVEDENTISRVLIDVAVERKLTLPVETSPPAWDATILISAESLDDCLAPELHRMVFDSAEVIGKSEVDVTELSDMSGPWAGTATPGSKVSFILTRSPGVDAESFDGWLLEASVDLSNRMNNGGTRLIAATPRKGELNFDAIATFWFPGMNEMNDAVESQMFSSILSSYLVVPGSTQVLPTVEHRRYPNPNSWAMPRGRLMPDPEP